MHVLILGGGSFIERTLATQLIKSGDLEEVAITKLTLVDVLFPDGMPQDEILDCTGE